MVPNSADDTFRWQVVALVMIGLVGTFVWDRVITAIFARNIFRCVLLSSRADSPYPCFCPDMLIGTVARDKAW
jgi:hypothetical protein